MAKLVIDIGASKTEIAAFEKGKLGKAVKFKTPKTLEKAILLAGKKAKALLPAGKKAKAPQPAGKKAKKPGISIFDSAGIAIPGFVCNGIASKAPNLACRKNFNAEKFAEKALHCQCIVENDVKCAALAEAKYGSAKNIAKKGCRHGRAGSKSVIAILVWPGSGIGGAIMRNGKLFRGKNNAAGEFGHMKLNLGGGWVRRNLKLGRGRSPSAVRCGCGKLGCFEAYCGGRGMEKAYFSKFKKRKSAKEIFSSGKPADLAFAKNAACLFGFGLAKITNRLHPKLIILGGSLSKAYLGRFRKTTVKSFSQNAPSASKNAKIVKSRLENAALLGAALAK